MIISLSGRIGSGKDTVGSIIQYLTAKDTGQFCLGRIQSGKSIEGHHNSTFEIKKYAGKLKQTASLLTGIPVEKFEDQEFKKTDLPNEWCYIENGYAAKNMTVRDFLQKLGTEAMRDGLHPNVWVNALFADYKANVKEWDEFGNDTVVEYPNWIITDTRFPNEIAAIELREGITIRVVRHQFETANFKPLHASETALDDAKFNYEIINDGTIEELIEKVKQILIREKIID